MIGPRRVGQHVGHHPRQDRAVVPRLLRGRAAEPRAHGGGDDAVGLPPGRGVSDHRGQEKIPVQPVHGRGGVRGHRRGARDVAQQRDLAYSLAAAVPAQKPAVLLGVEFAGGDREIGVTRITLPDQHGPGAQLHRLQRRRQAFDRGGGKLGEQGERAQQRDLHDRHGGAGVEAEHDASAGHGRQRQRGRHAEHRQPASAQVRQRRYQQGTQGQPGHREPLQDAEDPPDQVRRDRTLQQGAGGHHQQGVAGPGQQACRRDPGGFHPAHDHVGRRQLIGGSGHRRDEGGLRRAGGGHRGRGDHGSRVGGQRRARVDRRGRARHRRGLRQVLPGEQDHR